MWVRLDDGFFDHRKAIAAGIQGRELALASWCWSSHHRTDGFIPDEVVGHLAAKVGVAGKWRAKLEEVRLWTPTEGGYDINDFLVYNPSRDEQEAVVEKRSKAGRLGAERRWHMP